MPLFPQGGGLYPDSIDNAILADMPEGTLKGRAVGSGTGNPVDLTAAQVATIVQGSNLSYRNILGRNGGFEVWQRGAGGSAAIAVPASTNQYTVDGWWLGAGPNQASTVAQGNGIAAGSRFCANIFRASGQTGTGSMVFEFPLDTDEIAPMQGSIVTLSFTAFCNAGWTPAGWQLLVRMRTGTGAPAKRGGTVYPGEVEPISGTATLLAATATRFSFTSSIVVPTNATQAAIGFVWTPVGTAGAADVWAIDDVQLEIGAVATPFERRPFESELAACRRHFYKTFSYSTAPAAAVDTSSALSFTQVAGSAGAQYGMGMRHPVEMRSAPSLVGYNPVTAGNTPATSNTGTAWTGVTPAATQTALYFSATSPAGTVQGMHGMWHLTVDAGI